LGALSPKEATFDSEVASSIRSGFSSPPGPEMIDYSLYSFFPDFQLHKWLLTSQCSSWTPRGK